MRSSIFLVGVALLVMLPGCTVIGDCGEGVGNACGSAWSACTGVFRGGGADRDDGVASGDPVYDSAADIDRDEGALTEAGSGGAGSGYGAFRMP